MRRRGSRNWLSALVVLVVLVAVAAVLVIQLVNYSRAWSKLPPGLTMSGIDVGGLEPEAARAQLLSTFSQPVVLAYREHTVELEPVDVGLQVDADGALGAAEQRRAEIDFWSGFVDYLLDRPNPGAAVTVPITYSTEQLDTFLSGIAIRFDQPARPPEALPATLTFSRGAAGVELDVPGSRPLIDAALRSPSARSVTLVVRERAAPTAAPETLKLLLSTRLARFEGIAGVMVLDLRSGEEICLNCDVAFSGLNPLRLPVAVELFRGLSAPPDTAQTRLLSETLTLAGYTSANRLLDLAGGGDREAGAQRVTDDLEILGLANTFLAGPLGEPLSGPRINTPANSRPDVDTDPDPAAQTTPQDLALLLRMVYDCRQGGGTLLAAWPGDFGPEECDRLIDLTSAAFPGELIAAGVAPGTRVAQQAGWDGPTLGAAGLVFTPGGDFALAVYLWRDPWLEWPDGEAVVRDVARGTYNYFNGSAQVTGP